MVIEGIASICLVFSLIFLALFICSASKTAGIACCISLVGMIVFLGIADFKKRDKEDRQDEYSSVTISDKQGNLIHSYSGNIHYEGEDRLKIIDKEGNTIYYTIGDDEIFYGVH